MQLLWRRSSPESSAGCSDPVCSLYADAAEDNVICAAGSTQAVQRISPESVKALNCKMMYISIGLCVQRPGTRPWELDDKREPFECPWSDYMGAELVKRWRSSFLVRIGAGIWQRNGGIPHQNHAEPLGKTRSSDGCSGPDRFSDRILMTGTTARGLSIETDNMAAIMRMNAGTKVGVELSVRRIFKQFERNRSFSVYSVIVSGESETSDGNSRN